jgi:hypothetical protein
MVKEIKKYGKIYFQCEECSFLYEKRRLAEKCEAYCKKHNSCSLEITRQAVKS